MKMPNVHGAPVHMGDAAEVGVADVMKPDYGEAVDFYEGEIPVFWPCGVTSGSGGKCEAAHCYHPCAGPHVHHGYHQFRTERLSGS